MNQKEKEYFEELSKDRAETAIHLEKPSMRGIKKSVVEKYSDQAHFVYELLQNANDANASSSRFVLKHDCLIFAHNGTRQFSISNPKTEAEDSERGQLGDINAITSIAHSNKNELSTIGKFGVGFKSVFQYTNKPHIFCSGFQFKIERFIVPIWLEQEYVDRKKGETLFVFPFEDSAKAFDEIAMKLESLSYPVLFLNHLKKIDFEIEGRGRGYYKKEIRESKIDGETKIEKIRLSQKKINSSLFQYFWVFTRNCTHDLSYAVAFLLNRGGGVDKVEEPAFCFFPTREYTGLNFMIHAPFLLTDSREGIQAGVPHNEEMVIKLAMLAGDAIELLRDIGLQSNTRIIDENIITIIPYNPDKFNPLEDKRKISFLPFYTEIAKRFREKELLPCSDGYVSRNNAYWADTLEISDLFSDEQLCLLSENSQARWVFPRLARENVYASNRPLCNYIDSIICGYVNDTSVLEGTHKMLSYNRRAFNLAYIKGIEGDFVEKQSIEWLHRFYHWVSEKHGRKDKIMQKAIFLTTERVASALYDNRKRLILFLPSEDIQDCTFIHEDILKVKATDRFVRSLGIKEPVLKDYIYNSILPRYDGDESIDSEDDFKLFFRYFREAPRDEADELVNILKEYDFINYNEVGDDGLYRGKPATLYLKNSETECFLLEESGARFVDFDYYAELVGHERKVELENFLHELGVKNSVELAIYELNEHEVRERNLPNYEKKNQSWTEPRIPGLLRVINRIIEYQDIELSVYLWRFLVEFIERNCVQKSIDFNSLLLGSYRYKYHRFITEGFESSDSLMLKSTCWLVDKSGKWGAPCSLCHDSLNNLYEPVKTEAAKQLIRFLGIPESSTENLTESQRNKIAFADRLQSLGIDESKIDEIREFLRLKEQEENLRNAVSTGRESGLEIALTKKRKEQEDESESISSHPSYNYDLKRKRVLLDLVNQPTEKFSSKKDVATLLNQCEDADEYMPGTVDYHKKIEDAKAKSNQEIDKIIRFEELQRKVAETKKYTFGWFKNLLELECLNSSESFSSNREISISFATVEREPETARTLILKHPSRYLPHFLEELTDFPLVVNIEGKNKTLVIEAANIKSYTLRVKLKSDTTIDDIDFTKVVEAKIDAKSPAFLLEELRKQFLSLDYEDKYNLKESLPSNIEFIFGPPGTGKTTHLAKNVLLPLMAERGRCRVLVLAPTNKSADVLTSRIMEVAQNNSVQYNPWLVRFGVTSDEKIEQSEVYKDKTYNIKATEKCVVVTTIARFAYDFFMCENQRLLLNMLKWDYIVIDEASMIPLAYITYPLYKKTPRKFIIAGDPLQIQPITSVDIWKDENIYTMVELKSFANPTTKPHQYDITLLTTQYRSIPQLGELYSKFAYNGVLQHFRNSSSRRKIKLPDNISLSELTIIKFPVSRYESIYRAKRLHNSSYQVYSALFTFEYVIFIAEKIAKYNPNESYSIGIIAPYKAEADLIDKLFSSVKLPDRVSVHVGTIHGFQGDECDMVFAVFNPPPVITSSSEMFLNKRNIINVSISRAKDYFFVVMPDDDTVDVNKLQLIKKVEQLIKESSSWCEFHSPELERRMFNDSRWIENNSFSTGHQNVNVYGLPEKRYEIRTEDTAVDIQIHRVLSK